MQRRIVIPTAELFDRLTILGIKEVLDAKHQAAYGKEIAEVVAAIDFAVTPGGRKLDAHLIRLLVALAQVNLHIWYVKDIMQKDAKQFAVMTKLGHQLNGVRNQVKNLIAEEWDGADSTKKKTNTWTEDLRGWTMSITAGHDVIGDSESSVHHDGKDASTGYAFLLTDLIDALTIAQIKETLFSDEKKAAYVTELTDASIDIQSILARSPHPFSGRIARLIIFISQANLHVWRLKDEMHAAPERYNDLLRMAQDLNGLRNHARNLLMEAFHENSPARRKTTFLDFSGRQWYGGLLSSLGMEKSAGKKEPPLR